MPTSTTTRLTAFLAMAAAVASSPMTAAASAPATATTIATAPPPEAANAEAVLLRSPRHGEWMEVALPQAAPKEPAGGEGKAAPESNSDASDDAAIDTAPVNIRTWVVYPERSDKAPVVIVIHEIFGLTDWVRAVADDLAAHGFIAVAPDLLSGLGPDGGGTSSFTGDGAREAIRRLSREETNARLNAVRAAALALPAASDASACIGFCWGGSASFAYAAATPESAGRELPPLRGAVVCYGTAPTDRAILEQITCPVLGIYGGDDARVTSTVEATSGAMKALDKSFVEFTYAGAGHGFFRQQSGRDGANRSAAEDGWREAIAFLKSRTDPGAAGVKPAAAPKDGAATPPSPRAPK